MNTYLYIAKGYSKGGYGQYVKLTLAQGVIACPSWTNKKMKVIERTGKLYDGSTENCESARQIAEFRKDHPNLIIVY
jgi:hypothetical protein